MNTARLSLRALRAADVPLVYAMTSRPEVARFMRFDTHTNPAQAAALIEEYQAAPGSAWLIAERESGLPVGVFACRPGDGPEGEYGLSTFSAPEYWNRGYASEVLAAMLPVLRAKGIRALAAHVAADNHASRRVLEKQGFSLEKTLFFPELTQGLAVYRLRL